MHDLGYRLVNELAEYLGQPYALVERCCRSAANDLASQWNTLRPVSPEAILSFYQNSEIYLYDLTWWHSMVDDNSAQIQTEAINIARMANAKSVLDFGSGIGTLGLLLGELGITVMLAEVNHQLTDYARWRFKQRGLIAEFIDPGYPPDFSGRMFDFISAVDVIEHLPEPQTILDTLAHALNPGGVLFIHTPEEYDQLHPMHFQHNPIHMVEQLESLGLFLQSTKAGLVFLKRPANRYVRKPEVKLLPNPPGGTILIENPLYALRLNQASFSSISCLETPQTIGQVASQINVFPKDLLPFLNNLTKKGFLEKVVSNQAHLPEVSVIIPAHNRPVETKACIESLLLLDYPAEQVEIIIVDDASNPPLTPALSGLPIQIIRLDENIGQSMARNIAAARAKGEILAFTDNDCLVDPGWLKTLVPVLSGPGIGVVGGRVLPIQTQGVLAAFEEKRSPLDMGDLRGEVDPRQKVAYLPTCNLLVEKQVFQMVGGFDEEMLLGEDVDFTWRCQQAGWQVLYDPAGEITHHHRIRPLEFLKRRMEYGFSEARLYRKHPQNQRHMRLSVKDLLFLVLFFGWLIAPLIEYLVAGLFLFSLGIEFWVKSGRLHKIDVRLRWQLVFPAILRERISSLYYLSSNIVRYYSIPLLIAALFWLPGLFPLLFLLGLSPFIDYFRLKPRLSLFAYFGLFWLEMIVYQIGVWKGCLSERNLTPLFPILR